MDEIKKIIVIGASAGGFGAITRLMAAMPNNLPAAIFVVMHLSKTSSAEIIQQQLAKFTGYRCRIPADKEKIVAGSLYIAPADFHMVVRPTHIRLLKGRPGIRWRPSIDVLFSSAARCFQSRVIGIILTGMLNDGTSGMSAIKGRGGICIVQEPKEAEFAGMPENVLNHVDVDYRVPLSDISYILADLFSQLKNIHVPHTGSI